jgi:hypothetical protein
MIPPIFLMSPALPWLFAARCAAVYWQTVADALAAVSQMTASADIVPFPLAPRQGGMPAQQQSAEIVSFTPGRL